MASKNLMKLQLITRKSFNVQKKLDTLESHYQESDIATTKHKYYALVSSVQIWGPAFPKIGSAPLIVVPAILYNKS